MEDIGLLEFLLSHICKIQEFQQYILIQDLLQQAKSWFGGGMDVTPS